MALHPKNKHQGRYNFKALVAALPELAPFLVNNPKGDQSIDFANPLAVKLLNRALLKQFYNVEQWDIPQGYLCPPIPGRADYIHNLADLLGEATGPQVRILEIGVGANAVYPLIGHAEYGWSFVATDIDPVALESAQAILKANPKFQHEIELRHQKISTQIFKGIILEGEQYAASLCNPPFHASRAQAQAGSERKWKNLGKSLGPASKSPQAPHLNFGGKDTELWVQGGETGFISRMIVESVEFVNQVHWFTSLVSQEDHLPQIEQALNRAKVNDMRLVEMSQGQKKSRIVAWTFK